MIFNDVRAIVGRILNLEAHVQTMDASAELLGAIPELDSMAVVGMIAALEEHFGITVADDEINAATFATFGSLSAFVESKLDV